MTVYELENEPQVFELIKRGQDTLREAKKRRGQRPQDLKSRDFMYSKFMEDLEFMESMDITNVRPWSYIEPAYPPCTSPINELRQVAIRNLQLETHHRGTYLILRSIAPPCRRMTAIMALMEDDNGDVLMVELHQQEDEIKRAAANIVNVGTILLIKEPFLKFIAAGEYVLRINHLSDAIYIRGDDARIPKAWKHQLIENEDSAESLKANGNLSIKKRRYWDAITEYSDALNHPATADQIDIIKRNRALAFLKTHQFDAALADVGFPDSSPNPNDKALFRAADALYNLEKFSECSKVLQLIPFDSPHHSEASMALDRAQSRSREQRTGVYNFEQLQAKAYQHRPPHLDFATYIGPVEIRQTESKGRGLFTTKPVKAGDLLLCEKAFGHVYAANDGSGSGAKINMWINLSTKKAFAGTQPELIKLILQKLYRNPSLAPAFTALYHGAYERVSTSSVAEPIIDTFLVESIVTMNSISCPVSSLNAHSEAREGEFPKPNNTNTMDDVDHSCGIWTHASHINHCCLSNARRAFIGNMMIVRASCDMEAGTEITVWYHNPEGKSITELDERLQHWGFVCRCALCLEARATKGAVATKRERLMEDIRRACTAPAVRGIDNKIQRIEGMLDKLNQTYTQPAEAVPRLFMWKPHMDMTLSYMALGNARKSLESAVKLLTSLGFLVTGADSSQTRFSIVRWGMPLDILVEIFLQIRSAFSEMGSREDSERAKAYAKTMYRIIVGEDESFHANYD